VIKRISGDEARGHKQSTRSKGFCAKCVHLAQNPYLREDSFMKIPIENAASIGRVVRASRKAQKIRQDDAAGSIGVSENFLGKIERGSGSVQWGKLFQVLEGLGVRVMVDVPERVAAYLNDPANSRDKP
jgi:DNA-binding XRE family transcriptional regulator